MLNHIDATKKKRTKTNSGKKIKENNATIVHKSASITLYYVLLNPQSFLELTTFLGGSKVNEGHYHVFSIVDGNRLSYYPAANHFQETGDRETRYQHALLIQGWLQTTKNINTTLTTDDEAALGYKMMNQQDAATMKGTTQSLIQQYEHKELSNTKDALQTNATTTMLKAAHQINIIKQNTNTNTKTKQEAITSTLQAFNITSPKQVKKTKQHATNMQSIAQKEAIKPRIKYIQNKNTTQAEKTIKHITLSRIDNKMNHITTQTDVLSTELKSFYQALGPMVEKKLKPLFRSLEANRRTMEVILANQATSQTANTPTSNYADQEAQGYGSPDDEEDDEPSLKKSKRDDSEDDHPKSTPSGEQDGKLMQCLHIFKRNLEKTGNSKEKILSLLDRPHAWLMKTTVLNGKGIFVYFNELDIDHDIIDAIKTDLWEIGCLDTEPKGKSYKSTTPASRAVLASLFGS